MKILLRVAVAVAFSAIVGCQGAAKAPSATRASEPVAYMTLDEFTTALTGESDLVLVEFCVPYGCPSCDKMREPIDRLASNLLERVTVRRVDLNQHLQLAWELGFSDCPSYIAFRGGDEVFRTACPTSADLIASGLAELLDESKAEQLSIAAR